MHGLPNWSIKVVLRKRRQYTSTCQLRTAPVSLSHSSSQAYSLTFLLVTSVSSNTWYASRHSSHYDSLKLHSARQTPLSWLSLSSSIQNGHSSTQLPALELPQPLQTSRFKPLKLKSTYARSPWFLALSAQWCDLPQGQSIALLVSKKTSYWMHLGVRAASLIFSTVMEWLECWSCFTCSRLFIDRITTSTPRCTT